MKRREEKRKKEMASWMPPCPGMPSEMIELFKQLSQSCAKGSGKGNAIQFRQR